MKNIEKEQKNR